VNARWAVQPGLESRLLASKSWGDLIPSLRHVFRADIGVSCGVSLSSSGADLRGPTWTHGLHVGYILSPLRGCRSEVPWTGLAAGFD
jgi:hypothetical protein